MKTKIKMTFKGYCHFSVAKLVEIILTFSYFPQQNRNYYSWNTLQKIGGL